MSIASYLGTNYDFVSPFGGAVVYAVLLLCVVLFYVGTARFGTGLPTRWGLSWLIVTPLVVLGYLAFGEPVKVKAIATYFTVVRKKLA